MWRITQLFYFDILKTITINRKYSESKPSLWLNCFEGWSWAFYCNLWLKKKFYKKGIIWQNPKQSSAKQQPPTPNFKIRAVRQKATPKLILAALLKYWFNDLLPYYWRTCSNVFRQTRKQLWTGREAVTAGVWRGEASLCYVTMPVVDMLHANAWGFSTSQWLVPRNGHSAFSSPWWNHWWQNDKINWTVRWGSSYVHIVPPPYQSNHSLDLIRGADWREVLRCVMNVCERDC